MADKYIKLQNNGVNLRVNFARRLITSLVVHISWFINPLLVKKFILREFFAPRQYKVSDEENQLLQKAEEFRIMVNDQYVRCWKWGQGPTIVFVHGWNGRGIQFHGFIKESLARGYSVITFDGPGHGESQGDTSSFFEMTDAVRAVLLHAKDNNIAAVVGHSFGAAAIVNALHKDKQQIPAVLIAPALAIREMLDMAFDIHGVPVKVYRNLIDEYESRFGYNLVADNPKNLIPEFRLKALIIHDRQDKVTPFIESEQAANGQNDIKLFVTDGLGHKRILQDVSVSHELYHYIESQTTVAA